jgi:hypothetical protein
MQVHLSLLIKGGIIEATYPKRQRMYMIRPEFVVGDKLVFLADGCRIEFS